MQECVGSNPKVAPALISSLAQLAGLASAHGHKSLPWPVSNRLDAIGLDRSVLIRPYS